MPYIQEVITAMPIKKQSAIGTALLAASTWRLAQTNTDLMLPIPVWDTNADDMGKGTPFATAMYKNSLGSAGPWNARLTSENAALAAAFGIGTCVKTAANGGTGFIYTSTVNSDYSALDADLPYGTIVQACRQGASDIFDYALVGMCMEDVTLSLKSGIGRDTAMISTNWLGSGRFVNPSTITIPAATTEHLLQMSMATIATIRTVNYVTNLRLLSFEFTWKNNIQVDRNYVIGGGTQSDFPVWGRCRRGKPSVSAKMVVEVIDGSTEFADFLAGTTGSAQIHLEGALLPTASTDHHSLDIFLHQVQFKTHGWTNDNGVLTASIDLDVQLESGGDMLTWTAICAQDNIGIAAV
jgi:hypothetical protein